MPHQYTGQGQGIRQGLRAVGHRGLHDSAAIQLGLHARVQVSSHRLRHQEALAPRVEHRRREEGHRQRKANGETLLEQAHEKIRGQHGRIHYICFLLGRHFLYRICSINL